MQLSSHLRGAFKYGIQSYNFRSNGTELNFWHCSSRKSLVFGGHSWVLQLEYLLEGPVQSPSWHSRDSTRTPPPQVLEQSWSEFQSPHFPELSSVSVLYTKESTPTNKINNKRQNECQNFSVYYVLHKNLADWFMSASFMTLNPKGKGPIQPSKAVMTYIVVGDIS